MIQFMIFLFKIEKKKHNVFIYFITAKIADIVVFHYQNKYVCYSIQKKFESIAWIFFNSLRELNILE